VKHVLADPLARLRERASAREAARLRRRLHPRGAGEPVIDLAGNDYLGLSRDVRVVDAAAAALRTWGAGSTGSRLVTGSTTLHAELEAALAAHGGAERALVFSSGYLANLGAVTALVGPGDVVISDANNHASIIDACRLARAEVVVVPHADVDAVDTALAAAGDRRVLVVTDAVFSVDGDVAPVAELHAAVRRHGALLLIDEAHALGVVGRHGAGVTDALGLGGESDVLRTITLSKALGSQGGAVLAHTTVIDHLIDAARTFIFDTALAPAAAGAALAAVTVLRNDGDLPARVRARAAELAALAGRPMPDAAVIAVPLGAPEAALAAAAHCAAHGVRVGCFRPPTVPDGVSRLRLTARADLTDDEMATVTDALAGLRLEEGSR
jgi:8-amino-7-oxononanoate synthase